MFRLRNKLLFDLYIKMNSRTFTLLKDKVYLQNAEAPASGVKTFDVFNPANGQKIAAVSNLDANEVTDEIERAAEAFQTWKRTRPKERATLLRAWYDSIIKNSNELADIITAESGKPKTEALGEVTYGGSFIEWFSEEARRINGEVVDGDSSTKQMMFIKQPIGVVGLITPWNFPLAMITRKAGAALAAGCTCVIKPAEDTPLTALALAELARQSDIPPGVVNVVTCDRSAAPEIGKLLCTHEKIAGISFTGSTAVGKLLYAQCAGGIKRIALELGGNAPFIVFRSANIDKAVEGAMASKFRNCGQTCVSANRFLVEEAVAKEFSKKLASKMNDLVCGNGTQPNVTIGPLINKTQVEKVSGIVEDAISKGAKVMLGGKHLSNLGGLFYAPTILTNIKSTMRCYNEEIFGPIVQIITFRTEEEAIHIANSTKSGLAGYFYSENISQVWRVARELEMGMVGINEGLISAVEAAFGGVKESGIGREGSHHGIDEFVNVKYICFGGL